MCWFSAIASCNRAALRIPIGCDIPQWCKTRPIGAPLPMRKGALLYCGTVVDAGCYRASVRVRYASEWWPLFNLVKFSCITRIYVL